MKKKLKKIIICILLILIILYFFIGVFFYVYALDPLFDGINKKNQKNTAKEYSMEFINLFKDSGANIYDSYLNSTNNGKISLHSYVIENESSDVWVIVTHGYLSQGAAMYDMAKEFCNRGYNILIPDLRYHGLSEGNYIGMGWHDRLDIIDWINDINSKNENCKIILYGISMGAATTMMVTGEKLPDNVKLAISDCGYTSVWDEFEYKLNKDFKLPTFPALYAANTICKIVAHYDFKEASCIKQVEKSNTPTLFIHGSNDTFVPFYMLDKVYEAENAEKEKLVIENARHGESCYVDSNLYWETIDKFIDKYI